MKKIVLITITLLSILSNAQKQDTTKVFKKRVLENTEISFVTSYYEQDGDNAAITGGIGTAYLRDIATDIVVSIPLNADDLFSFNTTISDYTSASTSNLDPFQKNTSQKTGSPWAASSGASQSEIWFNANINYQHSANDRNKIWSANLNFATEFDYTSYGFGGSYTWLFNQKNTEITAKENIYLDTWRPNYPIEIKSFLQTNQNLNIGFFKDVNILNQAGEIIDKNGLKVWKPFSTTLVVNKQRNTYSTSLIFSQILSKKAQFSIFLDLVLQSGWLANPSQRVYLGDSANYYIGEPSSIPNYTSSSNRDVFQLADDIERLPDTRFKIPIGARFNYYINERLTLRTYYRYYSDDWGVLSHTASIELPIKISDKFTLYPSYRYYTQTAADYFAPYEENLSTQEFYTSDYDLSEFNSNQYGFGISYTDIFTKLKIWKLGLKNVDLKYSFYKRNTGLKSGIVSAGFKYIFN